MHVCLKITLIFFLLIASVRSFAGPEAFQLQGQLLKDDGTLFESNTINITLQIISPGSESCLLYQESHSLDLAASNGLFSLQVGLGARSGTDYEDTNSLANSLSNSSGLVTASTCAIGVTYSPSATDKRILRLLVDDGANPLLVKNHVIRSNVYAINATSLDGATLSDLLRLNNSVPQVTNQANLDWVFESSRYTELQNLINGTSSQYIGGTPIVPMNFNNQSVTNLATPLAGADLVNKNYVDQNLAGGLIDSASISILAGPDVGKILQWDGSQWVAQTPASDPTKLPLVGGAMSGPLNMGNQNLLNLNDLSLANDLTVGNNLSVTGTATAGGSTLVTSVLGRTGVSISSQGSDYQAMQIDNTPSGSIIASNLQTAMQELDQEKVQGSGDEMTGALTLESSQELRFADSDNSHFVGLRAPFVVSAPGSFVWTLPNSDGLPNQVLQTNGSGQLQWVSLPAGDISAAQNVGSGAGQVYRDEVAGVVNLKTLSNSSGKLDVVNAANDVTFNVNESNLDASVISAGVTSLTAGDLQAGFNELDLNKAEISISLSAGTGLAGGGDLSLNRSLSIAASGVGTTEISNDAVVASKLADTTVTVGSFGSASQVATFNVDQQGRLTSSGSVAISESDPGLQTMDLAEVDQVENLDSQSISSLQWSFLGNFTDQPLQTLSASDLDDVWSTSGILRRTAANTYGVVSDASSDWDSAFAWGDHSSNGYLSGESQGLDNMYNEGFSVLVDSSDLIFNMVSTQHIFIQDAGNSALSVLSNRNVGIGSSAPSVELDVNGTIRVTEICDETGANCKTIGSGWTVGSVSSVTAGTGLSGGTLTGSGTIAIASGGVDTAQIANDAVTADKLADTSATPGAFGSATQVGTFTVDAQGRLTASANVAVSESDPGLQTMDTGEVDQLEEINTVTISSAQWAYLGSMGAQPNQAGIGTGAAELMGADTVVNCTTGQKLQMSSGPPYTWSCVNDQNTTDHSALSNLNADDHTQYGLLLGRGGGQTVSGSLLANENLILDSTSNVSKGFILLQGSGGNVGIGSSAPAAELDVNGTIRTEQICDEVGGNCRDISSGWTLAAVSSIAAGTGLTGGPITSTGTLSIAGSGVGTTQLADDAVTAVKLAHTAVTPGSYGSATQVGTFTVDTQGRIIASSNVGIAESDPRLQSLSALEVDQVENIDSVNISSGQWGFLGAMTSQPLQAPIGTSAGDVMGADALPNCAAGEKLQMSLGPVFAWSCQADLNTVDHSALSNLTGTDVHPQYAMLAGRSGGQTFTGSQTANEDLTIESTSDASKGFVNFAISGGNLGVGTSAPVTKLHVDGEMKVGNTLLVCDNDADGAIRYNFAVKAMEYCNGVEWQLLEDRGCSDSTPNIFSFSNLTNQTTNLQVESSISQVTGISCDGVVKVSGAGNPEYRICSDNTCTTEIISWTSNENPIASGSYLQMRMMTSNLPGDIRIANLTVGTSGVSWSTKTSGQDCVSGSPVVGTVCADGSLYAGLSPNGSVKMFVPRCDFGQLWNGMQCTASPQKLPWNSGATNYIDLPNVSDADDGALNTRNLATTDDDAAPYLAALTCDQLNIHGQDDWFLPARNELGVICTGLQTIGNFDTSQHYPTSTEQGGTYIYKVNFAGCNQVFNFGSKASTHNVRCARLEPTTCSGATPNLFSIQQRLNQSPGKQVYSELVRVTGNNCDVSISISGSGSPEYRICEDVGCDVVLVDWTNVAGTIASEEHVQVRQTSSAVAGDTRTATLTVGTLNVDWDVVTVGEDCSASPNVGAACADGTIYMGLSPDGNTKMYVTRCDYGQSWSGSACIGVREKIPWNNNSGSNIDFTAADSRDDGDGNTASLVAASDVGAPYEAAKRCDDLNVHGHTDWYLPATDELNVICQGGQIYGNFDTSNLSYWSSTNFNSAYAKELKMTYCSGRDTAKSSDFLVRCARKE